MKTTKHLLALVFSMFVIGSINVEAQSIPVDTVCAGTTGKNYYVTATSGSTYNWVINGGTKASGGTTNSITIDFDNTTGVDTILVTETDSNGCIADPVLLAIVRMPNPTASISGTTTLCHNDSATISFTISGTFPLSLTYNDGTTDHTVNNISASPYEFNTGVLPGSISYSLISIADAIGCSTTGSGSANVTVLPKPVTSQIFH